MRQHQSVKRQLSRGASLDADVIIAPNKDGFIPPWDGWDFNDVEQCTDDLRVSRPRPPAHAMKSYICDFFLIPSQLPFPDLIIV